MTKIAHIADSFHRSLDLYGKEDIERVFNPNLIYDEVHIVSAYDINKYSDNDFKTLRIHPLPSPENNIVSKALYRYKIYQKTNEVCENNDIKLLVHEFGIPTTIALPMVLSTKKNKIPSIVSFQNDYDMLFKTENSFIKNIFIRMAMEFLLKSCTKIRSFSPYIIKYAIDLGISRNKIEIIPLPFKDVSKEKNKDQSGKEIKFITAAKFSKQKNLKNMIIGFKKALEKNKDIIFIICGDGKLKNELMDLAKDTPKILFLGHLPFNKLIEEMGVSDVFLFPTLFEGLPQMPIYAMMLNLPIICSNSGAITDIVRKDIDGIYVDPLNTDEIADAILALTDKELRDVMSKHEDYPLKQYLLKSVNDKEEKLYENTRNQ